MPHLNPLVVWAQYLDQEGEPWQHEEDDRDDEGDDGAQDEEVVTAGLPEFSTALHANLKTVAPIRAEVVGYSAS